MQLPAPTHDAWHTIRVLITHGGKGYRITVISTAAPNGPNADSDAIPSTISCNTRVCVGQTESLLNTQNAQRLTDLHT